MSVDSYGNPVPTASVGTDPVNLDSLAPQHWPCTFGGKRYVLHEPSEGAKAEYHGKMFRGSQVVDDKVTVSLERSAESPSLMVSLCLRVLNQPDGAAFLDNGKPAGLPVSQDEIKKWSGRLVKFLDEKAREMGGMSDSQESLEKGFRAVVEKLFKLSKNTEERGQWRNWMDASISEVAALTPGQGSSEEQAKN